MITSMVFDRPAGMRRRDTNADEDVLLEIPETELNDERYCRWRVLENENFSELLVFHKSASFLNCNTMLNYSLFRTILI